MLDNVRSQTGQVVGTILLTFLITLGWVALIRADLLHHWRRAPDLPQPLAAVVSIMHTTVYVRASDDHLYSLDLNQPTAWDARAALPATNVSGATRAYFGPCDRTEPRFAWYAGRPRDDHQCVEGLTRYADGSALVSVIWDQQGQVYYYATSGSTFGQEFRLLAILLMSAGLAYGIMRGVAQAAGASKQQPADG